MRRPATTVLAAAALAAAAPASAQPLVDPMRPPVVAASAAASVGAASALQTIVIRPDRRFAIIDKQTVALGERVGDARVVRIAETEVTLRDDSGGTRVLRLYPQVDKKSAAPADAARSGEERTR